MPHARPGTANRSRRLPQTMPKRRKKSKRARRLGQRWSARVTRESDALTLEKGVFTKSSPRKIAASLKRSADRSRRRKSDPYRSAMSMLNFYINRAGKTLLQTQRKRLQAAKNELRILYRKPRRSAK